MDEIVGTPNNDMSFKPRKMVTITQKEFNQLREDSNFLAALEAAGVDNWCGYDDAMKILADWDKES